MAKMGPCLTVRCICCRIPEFSLVVSYWLLGYGEFKCDEPSQPNWNLC